MAPFLPSDGGCPFLPLPSRKLSARLRLTPKSCLWGFSASSLGSVSGLGSNAAASLRRNGSLIFHLLTIPEKEEIAQ